MMLFFPLLAPLPMNSLLNIKDGRQLASHFSPARLAQSVEHETLNLGVVVSSPTLGDQFSMQNSKMMQVLGYVLASP